MIMIFVTAYSGADLELNTFHNNMLKDAVHPQIIEEAIRALNESRGTIMRAGEVTQVDHKANTHYVNIIFEIGHLITELKNAYSN